MPEVKSDMEQLYNQSIKIIREGQVVKGKIVSIKSKEVLVDVDFKSEGIVSIAEFSQQDLGVGRELEFFVESIENDAGNIELSREKAIRIQGLDKIVKYSQEGEFVEGVPVKKVKGGYLVDVLGVEGFLPSSLSAFKGVPEKDTMYKSFKFKIVKVNNLRRSIIVSRREAVQKEKEVSKDKIWQDLKLAGISPGK